MEMTPSSSFLRLFLAFTVQKKTKKLIDNNCQLSFKTHISRKEANYEKKDVLSKIQYFESDQQIYPLLKLGIHLGVGGNQVLM